MGTTSSRHVKGGIGISQYAALTEPNSYISYFISLIDIHIPEHIESMNDDAEEVPDSLLKDKISNMDEEELVDIRNSIRDDIGIKHAIKKNILTGYQKEQQLWTGYIINRANEIGLETKGYEYMPGGPVRFRVQKKYFPVKLPFVNEEVMINIKTYFHKCKIILYRICRCCPYALELNTICICSTYVY